MVKYPCRSCVYFKECGENTRTVECKGRTTKRERKREERKQKMFTLALNEMGVKY